VLLVGTSGISDRIGRLEKEIKAFLVINAGLFLFPNNLSHLNHIIGGEIATAGVDF
jgi:hypothetical protein